MRTLATRYPSFSGAKVIAPRPLGASLFPPVCDEPLPSDGDYTDVNETFRYAKATRHGRRLRGVAWPAPSRRGSAIATENMTRPAGLDKLDCVPNPTAWFTTCVELFQASLSISFVAVLETLISAKIAAKITKVKCNQRREVWWCVRSFSIP
jgi:hypothetical protein